MKTVEEIIAKTLGNMVKNPKIGAELNAFTNFVDDLGLDSLQYINFILLLEQKLNVQVNYDEFPVDAIYNFRSFVEYFKELVRKKDAYGVQITTLINSKNKN